MKIHITDEAEITLAEDLCVEMEGHTIRIGKKAQQSEPGTVRWDDWEALEKAAKEYTNGTKPFQWPVSPYVYINPVPCAREQFYRDNPGYSGALLLYCSCPRCNPTYYTNGTIYCKTA